MEHVQVARKWMAPEEAELQDVERQMEEELVQQHMHVERIIAQRPDPQDGSIRYLVKVTHLHAASSCMAAPQH